MNPKKHLSFGSLCAGFNKILIKINDNRQQKKVDYSIKDTMMSGLACMVFQDKSLLEFQEKLQEYQHRNNLQTLFGVRTIPTNNQMREIIDEVNSKDYEEVFKDFFSRLQRGKHLKQYEFLNGYYICPIDGTQYFSSNKIHCSQCLTKEHKTGEITYSHQALQAAIVNPDMKQAIPLMPEEIKNNDGKIKQDCEINAGKRLIPKIRKDHPQLNLIIVGDGLYSKQPFIETIMKEQMHYILATKPKGHKWMMEWLGAYEELNILELEDDKGKKHVYEWMNNVPLNARNDSLNLNYAQYKIISKDKNGLEKINYKNSWVTDIRIDADNAQKIVKAGRCRWKIENECFNTLKNQGYHIDHNYGHGKKNLCYNFFLLTLLAFFMHQIAELTDRLFQACRNKFGSKRHLWERLRSYITIILYESWEHLLDFALTPMKYEIGYGKT